ncbi:MAG: UbiA family prenyltransferase [Gemmatimonadota bacterium]
MFLWGVLLSGGRVGLRTVLAFLILHLLLYGGANAFNTYYDRDEGPIGGLERPPPVRPALLSWSLGLQAVGFMLALTIGLAFAALYLVLFLLFTAYSHPAVRLKARPWISLVAISLGQGGIGFAAGWVTAAGLSRWIPAGREDQAVWGFLSAVLIVAALYPLSQIYQVAEDRGRGEETLGVVLGRTASLGVTMALLVPAIGALLLATWGPFGIAWSSLLVTYGAGFLMLLLFSRGRLTESPPRLAYRRVMTLNYLNSTAFLLFIGLQLAGWG